MKPKSIWHQTEAQARFDDGLTHLCKSWVMKVKHFNIMFKLEKFSLVFVI